MTSAKGLVAGKLPNYSDYESIAEQPFRRGQLAVIGFWIRGDVLDVGSNFGRFSSFSPSTVSLDLEKRWLLRGIELRNIRQAVVGSALALPFKGGRFDTVLAIGIAEHIPFTAMSVFLDELSRVTKPTGRLIIQSSSQYGLFALLRLRLWNDYLHPCSPFWLRAFLGERGWRQVAWISSGLLGVTPILPRTVNSPVPWARSFCLVFHRG